MTKNSNENDKYTPVDKSELTEGARGQEAAYHMALVKMLQCLSAVKLVLFQNLFWWAIMTSSLAVLLFLFVVTSLADVTVKTRNQWGAEHPKKTPKCISTAVPLVIIHHSGNTYNCGDPDRPCATVIRSIQNYHMNDPSHKWDDIGYNFLISPKGEVFEGRGWGVSGAHAGPDYNSKSVGICLLGNYQETDPPAVQLKSTQELISTGVRLGNISASYELLGHRQVRSTLCPGEKLYKIIEGWPHYSSQPPKH